MLALDFAGYQVQAVSALVNPEKLDHLGLPIADLAALLRPRPY